MGENARRCAKSAQNPRNDKDLMPYASIDAYHQIGPVLNLGLAKILDVYGIQVQIQSE